MLGLRFQQCIPIISYRHCGLLQESEDANPHIVGHDDPAVGHCRYGEANSSPQGVALSVHVAVPNFV